MARNRQAIYRLMARNGEAKSGKAGKWLGTVKPFTGQWLHLLHVSFPSSPSPSPSPSSPSPSLLPAVMPREGPSLRRTTDLSTPKTEEHSCYSLHHRRGKHPSNPKCSSSSSAQTHPGAPLERSSSSFSQEKPDAIDDPKGKLKLIDAEEKLKVNGSIVNLNINYREEELEIESEETLNIVSDRKVKNNYEGNSSVCATSGQSSTYLSGAERVGEDVIRQRLDSLHIADSAVDDELSELQQEANKQEQQDEVSHGYR